MDPDGAWRMHDETPSRCRGGNGQPIRRGSCATCGTPLFDRSALRAGMLGIRSGTFDDPARYRPQAAIFIAHAPPRDRMLDARAQSGTSPCLPPA
jgi:hypothetical protein